VRAARAKAFLGLFACLTAALATPAASADVKPHVQGPVSVITGRMVGFHALGFHPGSIINVVLSPADKPSCCAIRIASTFVVSPAGDAALVFRMPRSYLRCLSVADCHKVRWTRRERAVVTVFGYLQQATTTTLVER